MTLNVKWPNVNIFFLVTGLIANINQKVKHYSRAVLLVQLFYAVTEANILKDNITPFIGACNKSVMLKHFLGS
jgi:hypothetical protein